MLGYTNNTTARARITSGFQNIIDIVTAEDPLAITYPLTYPNPANTDSGIIYAAANLQANRAFLAAELVAWINDKITIGTGIWSGFTYDSVVCSRDTGYLIDALTFDLLYGGNGSTVIAAQAYYLGAVSYIDGQEAQTVAAYNYLKSIVDDIIAENTVSKTTGNSATQVKLSNPGSLAATSEVQGLIDVVVDVISNGLSVLPTVIPPTYSGGVTALATTRSLILTNKTNVQTATINFINASYGGRGAILRARINGTVTGITVTDPGGNFASNPLITFVGGGNTRTTVAGSRYYTSASARIAIGAQLVQTLAGIERLRVVARQVIQNLAPATVYQTAVSRTVASSYTPPASIAAIVDIWTRVVYFTIENGELYTTSPALLRANRQFFRDELDAFWTTNFPDEFTGAAANPTVASRDIGLLVDAITLDLYTPDYNAGIIAALDLDFFDPITVSTTQPGGSNLEKTLQIFGVSNSITPNSFKVTFTTLEPVIDGFIIGYSKLDQGVLSY